MEWRPGRSILTIGKATARELLLLARPSRKSTTLGRAVRGLALCWEDFWRQEAGSVELISLRLLIVLAQVPRDVGPLTRLAKSRSVSVCPAYSVEPSFPLNM